MSDTVVQAAASAGRLYLLGLGSNLGDRMDFLRRGLAGVRDAGGQVLAVSPVVQTPPMGPQDQDDFFNACAWVAWGGTPQTFLAVIQGVEAASGRERTRHWGPRTLDLDLLWFSGGAVNTPGLTLPHPGLRDRVFVVAPALTLPLARSLMDLTPVAEAGNLQWRGVLEPAATPVPDSAPVGGGYNSLL